MFSCLFNFGFVLFHQGNEIGECWPVARVTRPLTRTHEAGSEARTGTSCKEPERVESRSRRAERAPKRRRSKAGRGQRAIKLREIIVTRNFLLTNNPECMKHPERAGGTFRIGKGIPGANTPPAPLSTHLFYFPGLPAPLFFFLVFPVHFSL